MKGRVQGEGTQERETQGGGMQEGGHTKEKTRERPRGRPKWESQGSIDCTTWRGEGRGTTRKDRRKCKWGAQEHDAYEGRFQS